MSGAATETEREFHLRFLESMDRLNRVIAGTNDLDHMMTAVLEELLSIFDCDRAWLGCPCDPETSSSWHVSMERTRSGYPSVYALSADVPIDADLAARFHILNGSPGPLQFGIGTPKPLSPEMLERFGFRSAMMMALRPKSSQPWALGLHRCAEQGPWTVEDETLFQEVGRRLTDGLSTVLDFRKLAASEKKYRRIVDTTQEGVCVLGPDTFITFINARVTEMLGYTMEEMIGRPVTDFMFAEDTPDYFRRIDSRQQGLLSDNYELRFRRKDGQELGVYRGDRHP